MTENKKIIKEIKGWTLSILGAFFIVAFLNITVFAKVEVQQRSMEPTLYSGHQLIIDKLTYRFSEPEKGDIIIFFKDKHKESLVDDVQVFLNNIKSILTKESVDVRFVKRVIATPGDEVDIKDGYVYVNGEKLDEPYLISETISGTFELPVKVPEGKLFVLGDNRPASEDSRDFGLIDYDQLEGKVLIRVYPFNQIGIVK